MAAQTAPEEHSPRHTPTDRSAGVSSSADEVEQALTRAEDGQMDKVATVAMSWELDPASYDLDSRVSGPSRRPPDAHTPLAHRH